MSLEVSLSLKYFKYTILLSAFVLAGCVFDTASKFSIDELPDATVGKPYSAIIQIYGGSMPNENNLHWIVTPENSGLSIKPTNNGYAEIEIYGTPNIKGHISVYLRGEGYGSFPMNPPKFFNKTFIIKTN